MTTLKGGNVIAIRATVDGETMEIRNDDGSPLTFIVEDGSGEQVELFMTVGRMGTYTMLSLPPFRVPPEGDWGERGIPTAPRSKKRVEVTSRPAEA